MLKRVHHCLTVNGCIYVKHQVNGDCTCMLVKGYCLFFDCINWDTQVKFVILPSCHVLPHPPLPPHFVCTGWLLPCLASASASCPVVHSAASWRATAPGCASDSKVVWNPGNNCTWSLLFLLMLAIEALSSSSSSLLCGFDDVGFPPLLLRNGVDLDGQPSGQVPLLSATAMTTLTSAKKSTLWSSLFLLMLSITASLLLLLSA